MRLCCIEMFCTPPTGGGWHCLNILIRKWSGHRYACCTSVTVIVSRWNFWDYKIKLEIHMTERQEYTNTMFRIAKQYRITFIKHLDFASYIIVWNESKTTRFLDVECGCSPTKLNNNLACNLQIRFYLPFAHSGFRMDLRVNC